MPSPSALWLLRCYFRSRPTPHLLITKRFRGEERWSSQGGAPNVPEKWRVAVAKQKLRDSKKPRIEKDPLQGMSHHVLGQRFSLFTTHPSSPGSPIFSPDGTHIFSKLQAFLRAQYPCEGFQEVITPTIYKKGLWEQSGHWENYKDDMFTVRGRGAQGEVAGKEIGEDEEYGLKPMNCPGHCLLFQSERRSYRDLPIRYADFSPLHRNEISGALSGMTRLRRFHQDDGHIFCRPEQVEEEITKTLKFVLTVYQLFDLGKIQFRLSTRPQQQSGGGFIGTEEEWDRAESQLSRALQNSGQEVIIQKGGGAFYGPKIDILVKDYNLKEHQTATIQLDFQLPRRLGLEYHCPAPELEAKGIPTKERDAESMRRSGVLPPILIHRAVLGSLERFMALMIERYRGNWPFWISPRQLIILTVTTNEEVLEYAKNAVRIITTPPGGQGYHQQDQKQKQPQHRPLHAHSFTVHTDFSDRSIAKKVQEARLKRYNMIGIIGQKNLKMGNNNNNPGGYGGGGGGGNNGSGGGGGGGKIDLSFGGQSKLVNTWDVIEKVLPGSQSPVQKLGAHVYRGMPGVQMPPEMCRDLMEKLTEAYL